MKKFLLTLALIPMLLACADSTTKGEPIKAELSKNETLHVYFGTLTDRYTVNGYSNVHDWGSTLTLTKVVYTYWENSNALDVETDNGTIKYRGHSTTFNIVNTYENRNKN